MDIKVFKDTITTTGQLCNTKFELPIETELLIPDYLPEVFKIVKSFVYLVVLQKQMQAGRLTIEGYFRVEVFYQGEEQSLCSIEQKVPFSRQIELKQGEWKNIGADVTGEIQYINCRAVNQRRLDIRGAYNLAVKVTADMEQEVMTAVSGMGLQQKSETVDMLKLVISPDKQFTLEEEINFEKTPQAVLHTQSSVKVEQIKLVSGKAVVKGDINVVVTYRTDTQLLHTEKSLSYNQIVELDGVDEDCQCQVNIVPVGCTIISAGDDGTQYQLSVTCILTVKAMKTQEFLVVSDGFSTQYETQQVMQEITTQTLLDNLTNTVQASADGKLPDSDAKILECYATCFTPELVSAENENIVSVRGRAIAHLICINALGEIECYDKVCEYTLPKKYNISLQQVEGSLTAQCVNVKVDKNGEDATAELTITVSGILLQKNKVFLVQELSCGDLLQSDTDVALRIYYAQAGEAVFDIAKRYHASPLDIAALAQIETDTLLHDQRLLIPLSE